MLRYPAETDAYYDGILCDDFDAVKHSIEIRPGQVHLRYGSHQLTLLHFIASSQRLDVLKFLLEAGADPNARDLQGRTPLYDACDAADVSAIELLVEFGAEINVTENGGRTPLQAATTSRAIQSTRAVARLIELGVRTA